MAEKTYKRKAYIRKKPKGKGKVRVPATSVRYPKIGARERARRASRAKRKLVPSAIKATARKGYKETLAGLRKYENHIKSPERLAGWLRTRPEVMRARGVPARKGRGVAGPRGAATRRKLSRAIKRAWREGKMKKRRKQPRERIIS